MNKKKFPPQLRDLDLEETDKLLTNHLQEEYIDHPTRGPYVKINNLFDDIEKDLDDRFSLTTFGLFCRHRPYLEKWSRGYSGTFRYQILPDEFE